MQVQTTMRHHLTPIRMAVFNTSTNRCWRGCGERGSHLVCWWECRLVQPLWKAVWRNLKKLKMGLPFDPVTPLLGIYLKEPKTLIGKNRSPLHCSVIYNHQDMEAAQVSVSRWVDKTTMGHVHNGILLSCKKKGKEKRKENFTLFDSIDGPGECYAKWDKPVRERQIPYDFTHM